MLSVQHLILQEVESATAENVAYRWFCFLTIDDPVFDHSTNSHFTEWIGRESFGDIFHRLNEELLRLGILSPDIALPLHPWRKLQAQGKTPGWIIPVVTTPEPWSRGDGRTIPRLTLL